MGTVDGAQRDWGASGLAHLTGLPSGFPDFSRAGVLAAARSTAADLHRHLGVQVNAAELLAGRAALLGLSRRGRISAGGATRLVAARDGWCALTLSRPDDVDAVSALVESAEQQGDPWPIVEAWALAGLPPTSSNVPGCSACPRALGGRPSPLLPQCVASAPPLRCANRLICWSSTCRRCGRDPCAGSCFDGRAPPS